MQQAETIKSWSITAQGTLSRLTLQSSASGAYRMHPRRNVRAQRYVCHPCTMQLRRPPYAFRMDHWTLRRIPSPCV